MGKLPFSAYEVLHNEINQYNQNKALEELNQLQKEWAWYKAKSMMKGGKEGAKNLNKANKILEQMKNVKVPDGSKIAKVANGLDKVGKGLNVLDLVIKVTVLERLSIIIIMVQLMERN